MCSMLFQRSAVVIFLIMSFPLLLSAAGENPGVSQRQDAGLRPTLSVTPRELRLGAVGPEGVVNGSFSLKNTGTGILYWSTFGPEGWRATEDQDLIGVLARDPQYIHVSLTSTQSERISLEDLRYRVQLTLSTVGKTVVLQKVLPSGSYRDALRVASSGGTRTVFLNYTITDSRSTVELNVEPAKIDFGLVEAGKQVTQQITITNRGKRTIDWRFSMPAKHGDATQTTPLPGRYISLFNPSIKGSGGYMPAPHLKEVLDTVGNWQEQSGFPVANGQDTYMQFRFAGTGVSVTFRHSLDGGQFAFYIDDQLVQVHDSSATERVKETVLVAEGLPDGRHVLTILNGDGRLALEGVEVHGTELARGRDGWITVTPDSGTTRRETDYAYIRLDTRQLAPGLYGEQLVLQSSQGDIGVSVYVEIKSDKTSQFLDVYRYVANFAYLLSTDPDGERKRIKEGGYTKEGIVFRLFAPGTPGTTEFYRWYSKKKGDHYYSYAMNGGGRYLQDYLFEGSIGNIATSKLTGTRTLYRWHNPKTGRYFFTIYENGENIAEKGYRFDGIAGYVK